MAASSLLAITRENQRFSLALAAAALYVRLKMKRLCISLLVCLISCGSKDGIDNPSYFGPSLKLANTDFSAQLECLAFNMEAGDDGAWLGFKDAGRGRDGETALTYSIACFETLVRDPTFFLRKHIAGDSSASELGERGFKMAGPDIKQSLRVVFQHREMIEDDPETKRLIGEYIVDSIQGQTGAELQR